MTEKVTTKVQANVDQKVVNRVNLILKSIGQSPTSIINGLYHAIDNTGKIPFEIGLTAKQKAALDIQQRANRSLLIPSEINDHDRMTIAQFLVSYILIPNETLIVRFT